MNIDDVKQVCVIGAGAMGSQIGLNTAIHGYSVTVYDISLDMRQKTTAWAKEYLDGRVEKGRMTREQADMAGSRFSVLGDLEQAAGNADLVIEAATEKLDLKRKIFGDLDKVCKPSAILATNSSTIVSSKLADATGRPDKVANLHYFNPALVMQVVEVVQGPHTSDDTARTLVEFAKRTGKQPIHMQKEIFGFCANRLLHALAREAFFLLENGYATHEEIDLALEKALGHSMGVFRLMDLTGLDVGYLVRMQKYEETGDPADLPPPSLKAKYERGELGRKTGKGWYEYPQGAKS
jgi:3-hydroxybutyryl-CoA dehydrogenase